VQISHFNEIARALNNNIDFGVLLIQQENKFFGPKKIQFPY
jgi:hypothetical protein